MSALRDLYRWIALAGIALAVFCCFKYVASTNSPDSTESVYSVSSMEAKAESELDRLSRLENIEAPPEVEALKPSEPNQVEVEIVGKTATQPELVGSEDNSFRPSTELQPADRTDLSPASSSATVAASPKDMESKTSENPGVDSATLASPIRTNQTSVAGFSKNPYFDKSNSVSDVPNSEPVASAPLFKVQPKASEPDPILALETDRIESAQSKFSQVVSNPIQFAQTGQPAFSPGKPSLIVTRINDSVAIRAVQHIEYGKTLARRGAKSSARQEFMTALSIIAQNFDDQRATTDFSQALRRGTLALKESEEFAINDSEAQIGMDISTLVESHQSGALAVEEAAGLSPLQALQRYFGYAQSQIEIGVGQNVISAEALYCLGRLYTLADGVSGEGKLDRARAMVFHRAALSCDPKNYRSANELGVLLAEFGELKDSVKVLKTSLRIQPTTSAWTNLAKVHERLNQAELAALAIQEAQRTQVNPNNGIHWVESKQFNASAPAEVHVASNPPAGSAESGEKAAETGAAASPRDTQPQSLSKRIKSWF